MPAFDKTGPQGQGSLTGRGMGPCAAPFGRQAGGRGMGMRTGFGRCGRFGRGLGRYFGWNTPQTKTEQKQDLADYRKALEEELDDIRKEEAELNKE